MRSPRAALAAAAVAAALAVACGQSKDVIVLESSPDLGPAPSHCGDNRRDADETDVDCGGSCGPTCAFGQACQQDGDCADDACQAGVCVPRSGSGCFDRVKDGSETDVDCGGGCPKCGAGLACASGGDCESGLCAAGRCGAGAAPFALATPRFADVKVQGPVALVARDFDGDGRLDVAVVGARSAEVALALGRGDGTFDDAQVTSVAGRPEWLVAGDLDGDGAPDVAVNDELGGTVTVLASARRDPLVAGTPIPVCASPRSLAAGDFDGDGRLDLAVACGQAPEIDLLLGRGGGAFQLVPTMLAGATGGVDFLAPADLDGDGRLDVAALVAYQLYAFAGDGHGNFGAGRMLAAGTGSWFVLAAKLAPGGPADLVASSYQGALSVLVGAGDGTFATPLVGNLGGAPYVLDAADFDGDGLLDLLAANEGPNTLQILRGLGGGRLDAAQNFYVGGTLQAATAGDFDGDGRPDVAFCDYWTHDVGVALNAR